MLEAETLVSVEDRLTWRAHKRTCGMEHYELVVHVRPINVLAPVASMTGSSN